METIKVLLVDDEKDFVVTLSDRIKKRNFESDFALSGERAIELVHNQVPDVLVLDLKMSGMDGFEVLRHVKQTNPDTQVIILTGYGTLEDRLKALSLGAFELLDKPVTINELIRTIEAAYQKVKRISQISST